MHAMPFDPPELAADLIPQIYGLLAAPNVIMQWIFTVVLCTVLSKLIYGLRRELRHAQRLGQYTLEAKIGAGGMGTVYPASHAMMRRPTAIKLLSPDAPTGDREARFKCECRKRRA